MHSEKFESPLGTILIKATDNGLLEVSFVDSPVDPGLNGQANHITNHTIQQLNEYFNGTRRTFDIPLEPGGTTFQQQVWQELIKIPFGKTSSYSAIANTLQNPLSVRAVGLANGKNPIAIIIPCHRVIGADGSLTGYAGGLWRKEKLLLLEGSLDSRQSSLWEI